MISRFLKKLFYLFRIMPVLSSLFFINIFFTTLIKLSSFKNTLNISKKNAKIIYKPNIKIKHLIIFQDLISKLLPFNTCLVKNANGKWYRFNDMNVKQVKDYKFIKQHIN